MRRFINLVMTLLAIPMILLSCDAVQSWGGGDSPGGDNSSGSSQFDRIIDKQNGLSVTFSFNGEGLGLPDGASYEWNFGDEQTSTDVAPTHEYAQAGNYTVTVRVTGTKTDGSSFDETFNRTITVKENPVEASNSYLYAEKNKENHLQYSFYTPMVFAGVPSENVTYEWYADNKSAVTAETQSNVFGYIYDKYGKTYTAQVTAKSGTGLESYATVNITTPSPEVDLICTTQGLTVTCYPEITLDGEKVDIPMDFEWDCGDGNYRKTSGTEPNTCIYDESKGNEQTIKVEGSSDKLENPVTDEKTVYISSILNVGQVECNMAGKSDHLTWDCNIITTVSEEGKNGTLEYRWHFGEDNADWTNWELINPGNNSKTHTYAKYRNSNSPDYNVQVEVRYKANNGTEAVQTAETADTTEYFEQGASSTKIRIQAPTVRIEQQAGADNRFERTFTAFFDYIPKGALKYTWNFGDGNTKQTDTYIATHTYNNNGDYEVTVSIESAESEKVFPNGYIDAAKLNFNINENINISDKTNAIKKTQHADNPLKWDFRLEGVSSSTGNLVYTWKKDGQVIGTNSTELNNVTFDKFGKSYSVTVEISIEGTDIKETISTDVTIDIPTVKINVPSPIMTGKDAVFTNTITYGSVDVKNLLTSPVVYSWVVDNDPLKTDSVTKNWKNPGEGKAATLTVTAGNVERPMIAPQETFNVLQSQLFGDVRIECNNNGRLSDYDTIRWTCTGTAMDKNNQEMEVEPDAYRYEWYAEPNVSDTVDTVKTTLNKAEATIILDWPTDKKAKNTPSQTYKICAKVFDTNNAASPIATKCQGNITVQRKVSYTAKVKGSDGTGQNVQNIIQVTALNGPANATYKWVHKIDTYYGNNNISQSDTQFPISGLSTKGEINLNNQVNNIGFIGKIIGNPFAGANGIGLEVSGNGLSRPVKIYGLENDNQMLGPSFTWCSNSYHIIHSRAYEETANTQNPNMPWGDINKNGRYEHGEGNLIYIWGIRGVNTKADMSREQGVFAKITVLSQNAKSLRRDGLLWVGGNIATINDTLEINKTGNSSAPANALVFYLDRNNAAKNGGTFNVLLKVKDTSRNGGQQFIDYGTCSSTYSTSIEW